MSIYIYIYIYLCLTKLHYSIQIRSKYLSLTRKNLRCFVTMFHVWKPNIGYSIFEGSDVGRQDGQTDGVRLTSGPFGTFWGPYPLSPPKIVNLAQLLHGQKLRTDKQTNKQTYPQTNKQTHKQTNKQIYIATTRLKTISLLSFVAGDNEWVGLKGGWI